ncbi:MAG: response regulator [Lentisphaerae bacterium]|nr:response regulator [Lentisphaerota bacterium]
MKSHILIVDDDEIVLTGLAGNLEEFGYRISTAGSARDALAVMADAPADLVLTDLVMEEMDGLGLLRRLRESHKDVPVIVITGHGTATSALDAVRQGASDYIQKPARAEEIAHRIDTVLSARRLRSKIEAERETSLALQAVRETHVVRSERIETALQFARGLSKDCKPLAAFLADLPQAVRTSLPADAMHRLDQSAQLLRDLAELGEGFTFHPEPVHLNDIVTSALDTPAFRALRDARPQVLVDARLSENLAVVSGSPSLLRQAIVSLASTFLHPLEAGGRLILSTGTEHQVDPWGHYVQGKTGTYAFLRLHSSWRAEPEELEHLFEPYAVPRCAAAGISALALTRVVLCMRAHKGLMQIRSEPSAGTEAKLLFPVAQVAAPEVTILADPTVGATRVLVVDDMPQHRAQAIAILRDLGYTADEAASSAAAIERATAAQQQSAPYDAFLVDLILGEELDGVDVMRQVLSVNPAHRVILMGGFADTARISEARKAGAVDYLRKPLTRHALGKAMHAATKKAEG